MGSSGIIPGSGTWLVLAVRLFTAIIIVGLPFAVIYFIVSPEARRQMIARVLPLLLLGLFIYILQSARLGSMEQIEPPVGLEGLQFPDVPGQSGKGS